MRATLAVIRPTLFSSYFRLTIKEKTLGFVVAHELHVNHYRVEGEIWQFDFHLRHNDIRATRSWSETRKRAGSSDGTSPQQKARRVCTDVYKRGKTVPSGCD